MSTPDHLGGHLNKTHIDEGVLRYLKRYYLIDTMVDIGCGPGGMRAVANQLGVRWYGVDGDPAMAGPDVIIHDFTQARLSWPDWYDLAWSVEFLEHVEERYQTHYMTLFSNARYAFVTAAPEGAPGHHHVNCRNEPYWIDTFREWGLTYLPEVSKELRNVSTMTKSFTRRSGMFFINHSF